MYLKGEKNYLKIYLDQIKNYPVLSLDEEKDIVKKMIFYRNKEGDENKKQYALWRSKLISHNLKLGVFYAKRMSKKLDIPLPDAIGYANEGLCKAADKYELNKGSKFSSYVSWWCLNAYREGLLEKPFRLDCRKYSKLAHFKRKLQQLTNEKNGGCITFSDIMKKTNLSLDNVKQYWQEIQYLEPKIVTSLDTPVHSIFDSKEDFASTEKNIILNGISSNDYYSADKSFEKKEAIKIINDIIIKNFCPSDYKIIVGRFGLGNRKTKSLMELSKELNISIETVRLHEKAALRKLRSMPEIASLYYNGGV
jgi:RNA polymerase sigma factor (sigma-70 family)